MSTFLLRYAFNTVLARAGEPERPKPHDFVGDGAGANLFFLQEPENF